jgi:uncharacterized protein (TIGR02145 family)
MKTMRYLLTSLLLAIVVLSSGCDSDGYSCNSEGCYEDTDNPQYQTLEDCNSLCDEPKPGGCGSLVLHEDYLYSTVQIGNQCWFAENCRYLPVVSPSSEGSETEPNYYVYDYQGTDVGDAQATTNYDTYGVLYNWPAVMTEGICPSGWHIPSDGEFTQLIDFLGGENIAGQQMKSTSGWSINGNGSNSSGFDGRPGGYAHSSGFNFDGISGFWWSSSASGSSSAWTRRLDYGYDGVSRDTDDSFFGFSARCVRD